MNSSPRSCLLRLSISLALSSLLSACAVVTVVDTAASLAIGTVELVGDAVIGTARVVGNAVGATVDAVLPGSK
jgi:hypothetical protein